MKRIGLVALLAAPLFALLACPVLAHHALAAGQPLFFESAFLSGLAHPMINLEHFAYILAIGVLAAVAQGPRWLPSLFVAGTMAGCALALNGYEVPFAQWLILVALVVIGCALVWGRHRVGTLDIAAFLLTGVLYGSFYAEAIVGNVNTPAAGYLLGYATVQTIVATGAMLLAFALWRGDRLYENARVVGGAVAGVGLTLIVQGAVQALLPLV